MCLQIINSTVWSQTPSHFMYRLVYQTLDLFHQVLLCLGDNGVGAGWRSDMSVLSGVASGHVVAPRTKLMKKRMMPSKKNQTLQVCCGVSLMVRVRRPRIINDQSINDRTVWRCWQDGERHISTASNWTNVETIYPEYDWVVVVSHSMESPPTQQGPAVSHDI